MVLLTINGIEVDFPYTPYAPQVRYMSSVIDALRRGQNALLESPTGTGKTLCLLCAALAWRATYIAALQALALATPDRPPPPALLAKAGLRRPDGPVSALAALVTPARLPHLSSPRIVFASRTHSQLGQAVAELKKTVYKPAMSLLASRDQLCLHDVAANLSGSRLNAMCRRITAPTKRQCRYHLPVASSRPHENRAPELVEKAHAQPPMDIEDLRAFGTAEGACPWFLSRVAAKSEACEILFLPYNYLLDRSARASLGIDWTNDILIIDEAHNLESICSESMSFDMSEGLRRACDAELTKLIEHAVRPGGLAIPALEELANTEGGLDKVIGSEKCELLEIRLMRSVLMSLEDFVGNVQLDRGQGGDVTFKVFQGDKLRKVLEDAGGPTADTYELFLDTLDRAMGIQADKTNPGGAGGAAQVAPGAPAGSAGGNAIRVLQTAIRVLFESGGAGTDRCFRTVVQQSAQKPAAGRTVSYWCFKPAIAMKSIQALSMRCMLLTSGTLSPMDSFAAELGLQFPVRLENPHVVSKPQVWAGVVRSGPDHEGTKGGRLTSAYHARGDVTNLELGRTLIKIASLVPDGLLVFFPSYSSMYTCMDLWKRSGPGSGGVKPSIWEHLLRHKRIVAEERESAKFSAAILAHRTNIDARAGSMLLAVCRGKVSEGIDFSDEYGRAVVITGLPYPSAFDPKVVLKREFADEEVKACKQGPPVQNGSLAKSAVIGGSEWYTIQAVRAVNQAIGRAIRHKYDYGAIVLCDERFQAMHLQGQISKWIRPSLMVCPTFQRAETTLGSFFANAVRSSFAKEGEQKRLEAKQRKAANASPRKPEEDTDAVMVAQQAITNLLPPPTTEKEFVAQVMSLSNELKVQERRHEASSKRRAAGVHDSPKFKILDFSDNRAENVKQDSGPLREKQEPKQSDVPEVSKQTDLFLATRAKRIESEGGNASPSTPPRTVKRIRITPASKPGATATPNRRPARETLSQRIRKVLSNTEEVKEFLHLFREMLSLHSKVTEGAGPLQTPAETARLRKRAQTVVQAMVQYIQERTDAPAHQKLLSEIRLKVPSSFHAYYDTALHHPVPP